MAADVYSGFFDEQGDEQLRHMKEIGMEEDSDAEEGVERGSVSHTQAFVPANPSFAQQQQASESAAVLTNTATAAPAATVAPQPTAANPYDWRKNYEEMRTFFREPQRDEAKEERLNKQRNMQLLLQGFGSLVDLGQHAGGGTVAPRNVSQRTDQIDRQLEQMDNQYKADGKVYDQQMAQLAMRAKENADGMRAADERLRKQQEFQAAQASQKETDWISREMLNQQHAKALQDDKLAAQAREGARNRELKRATQKEPKPFIFLQFTDSKGTPIGDAVDLKDGEALNLFSKLRDDNKISKEDFKLGMFDFTDNPNSMFIKTKLAEYAAKDGYSKELYDYVQRMRKINEKEQPQVPTPTATQPKQQASAISLKQETMKAIDGIERRKDLTLEQRREEAAYLLAKDGLPDEQIEKIVLAIK